MRTLNSLAVSEHATSTLSQACSRKMDVVLSGTVLAGELSLPQC